MIAAFPYAPTLLAYDGALRTRMEEREHGGGPGDAGRAGDGAPDAPAGASLFDRPQLASKGSGDEAGHRADHLQGPQRTRHV